MHFMKHGYARVENRPKEYNVWRTMRQRCCNPRNRQYPAYGGRGIRVCERWDDFENFYADMGPCPQGLTLERKDNSKGYSPDNCIWASYKEQARNTRRNHLVTMQGRTQCIAAWCEDLGVSTDCFDARRRYGWDIETALTKPVRPRRMHYV